MQVLIATGKKALVDEADFSLGDFIRVQKEEVIKRDEDEPEPPPEVDEPPPQAPDTQVDDLDTSAKINIGGPAGKIDLYQRFADVKHVVCYLLLLVFPIVQGKINDG